MRQCVEHHFAKFWVIGQFLMTQLYPSNPRSPRDRRAVSRETEMTSALRAEVGLFWLKPGP
jgi:hypothetical protein